MHGPAAQRRSKMISLFDTKVDWPESVAVKVFDLALECIQEKSDRPFSDGVLQRLQAIYSEMI